MLAALALASTACTQPASPANTAAPQQTSARPTTKAAAPVTTRPASTTQPVAKPTVRPSATLKPTASPSAAPKPASAPAYKVVWVSDGDTIDVLIGTTRQRVRILGINAPEVSHYGAPGQCWGSQARQSAITLLMNQRVTLVRDPRQADRDRFGRLLRFVTLPNGQDAAISLLRSGAAYAWHPRSSGPTSRSARYSRESRWAQAHRRGLWTCSVIPTPPSGTSINSD